MKKQYKAVHVLLCVALCVTLLAGTARAETTLGFRTAATADVLRVGETTTVTVALTGYDEAARAADAIRGVQVDITGIDPALLSVESCASRIADTTAVSNTATYNASKNLVRLVYAQFSGSLAAPCEEIMQVVFRVNPELTTSGSITLPVTVKIQTVSQQITQTGQLVLRYEPEIISVDISWGAMDFSYDKGLWNPQQLVYEGAGWEDGGTGYISVTNSGNTDTTAKFAYETDRSDISGHFTRDSQTLTSPVALAVGEEARVRLCLTGEPETDLTAVEIGRVTVRIGGE